MRALINGVEGNALDLAKGADAVFNARITNDDGSFIDTTTDVDQKFILYDTADRRNAAILTITCAVVAAAQGTLTATISDAQSAALTSGATYYAFIKRNAAGPLVSFGKAHSTITMR